MSINDRIKDGDRIRLLHMPEDPRPIAPGSEGVVTSACDLPGFGAGAYSISVKWDSGRTLSLTEQDIWEKVA
jgi:hypothetical protein